MGEETMICNQTIHVVKIPSFYEMVFFHAFWFRHVQTTVCFIHGPPFQDTMLDIDKCLHVFLIHPVQFQKVCSVASLV